MERIEGTLRHYPWGHRTAIAELLGRAPSGAPEAELWLGAHPASPSTLADGRTLDEIVDGDLPFLLKVLAAAKPLSLQAHPDSDQATAGFEREEAAGVPVDAFERIYRDPRHKPELICALTRFDALCGFRPLEATRALFEALGSGVEEIRERLGRPGQAAEVLSETLTWLLSEASPSVVEACVEACRSLERRGFADEAQTALDVAAHFPGDPAVVVALLLNRVVLEPGEALFLVAGNLHAYLGGVAVEVMANSDNVVRGGFTDKHIDVPELLRVVDASPIEPEIERPDDWNHRYRRDAAEFALHRYEFTAGRTIRWQSQGPAILLTVEGSVSIGDEQLGRGQAAYLGPDEPEQRITGEGLLFAASSPRT